jgi:hypothetical protein
MNTQTDWIRLLRAETASPRARHIRLLVVLLTLLAAVAAGRAASAATGPSIQLFPSAILEDIKHTGRVAQDMETGLQETIARLDQQQQLYQASKCEGADNDPGCAQIARQLGATYLEMLEIMGDRLPEMETAVESTRSSLEKRLRRELGQKSTPWGLQELLLGAEPSKGGTERVPALRGRSGMRLSDRFRRYHQLVSHSRNGNGHSLAVIASDIYLDMDEAAALIAMTREEINRAQLMEQLNQSFGLITPEMEAVVTGVKGILFGEASDELPIAGAPPAKTEDPYRSPLAM